MMPWEWPGTKPVCFVSQSLRTLLCVGGDSWGAGGCHRGAGGAVAASGGFSCLCWFAEPFNRPASFSGLTAVGSNAFGGLGNPTVSEYLAHGPPALQLSRATQGTLCSLFYCLVTSPVSKRWESGKRPFPVVSKLFSVNYLIVWAQASAKCYHYIVHLKKKKKEPLKFVKFPMVLLHVQK